MSNKPISFIDLYLSAIGHSEVPREYHEWSALSLLAACLNDRCWYEKHPGSKLYPNLYIMLVGPSGGGKDAAIDHASSFAAGLKSVHEFYGKCSGAGLADVLDRPNARRASSEDRPTVWLVLPELANSIGKGPLADDMIKRLTALYGGKAKPYQEVTRSLARDGNDITYRSPLINCLFGSTLEWAIECITNDAINSGFFGRMLICSSVMDYSKRITDPEKVEGYEELIAEIRGRIRRVIRLSGPFTLNKEAARLRDHWYQTRAAPEDDRLSPMWRRADDNILKIAMSLSPAVQFGADKLVIDGQSWIAAQKMVAWAYSNALPIIRRAAHSADSMVSKLERVADVLRKAGRLPHTVLLKRSSHHGIHAREMKEHVEALIQRKDVRVERNGHGARVYVWRSSS